MTELEIAQRLQQALGYEGVQLQAKWQGTQLFLMINRAEDIELDYPALAQWFATAISSLTQGEAASLMLYSRINGATQPDWSTQIWLTPAEPTPAPSPTPSPVKAAVNMDPPTSVDIIEQPQPVKPAATPAPAEPSGLAKFCFISNKLMLSTPLPVPPAEVIQAVYFVHRLDPALQPQLLAALVPFLRNPDDFSSAAQLPPNLRQWVTDLKRLGDQKIRGVAVWLSRYCAHPNRTLDEVGPPTDRVAPAENEPASRYTSTPASSSATGLPAGAASRPSGSPSGLSSGSPTGFSTAASRSGIPSSLPAPSPLPEIPLPAAIPTSEKSFLAQYCFVNNRLLLTTTLSTPPIEVIQSVYYFHLLSNQRQRDVAHALLAFFKDPETAQLTLLEPEEKRWLGWIKTFNDQKFRGVAVWISRYCVNAAKTLMELGPAPEIPAFSEASAPGVATGVLKDPRQSDVLLSGPLQGSFAASGLATGALPPTPPAGVEPEVNELAEFCFVSNRLLLTTSLPTPAAEVVQAVQFFHKLTLDQKRAVLASFGTFFQAPETADFSSLSPELQDWLQGLKQLNEQKFRGVAVWISRYCANAQKALTDIGLVAPPSQAATQALGSARGGSAPRGSSAAEATRTLSPDEVAQELASAPWTGAGRAKVVGIPIKIASFAGNLALASGVSLSLLAGMVLVLVLAMLAAASGGFTIGGLLLSILVTLIFNLVVFLVSPFIMDLVQGWLYQTRWVQISDVQRLSPEAAAVLQRVCSERRIPIPKLGIIDDQNPTAFTYGSFPATARVVVSQGLFTYLADDEVATVYAHELGHIVHWDFAVMTLASTLVQITYLIYRFINDKVRGDNKFDKQLRSMAMVAYLFYVVGTYLVLYLSRVREYFADHFAAQVTGNPNGLSRALIKIAYGIVEATEKEQATVGSKPSRLLEGTRALGIYDANAALGTATAYRVAADSAQVGRVFLWDLFNPWAWWMELGSTHPLTGKRVRALGNYAEQLGLESEFDMGKVVAEGKRLDRRLLFGNFLVDVLLMNAPFIGGAIGILLALPAFFINSERAFLILLGTVLLCGCVGLLLKTAVMFPRFTAPTATTVLKAMSNPYASPLRGIPLQLQGQVIGRGDAGYRFGSDLKLQDASGLIYLRYASRFGPLGNFLFGASQVIKLLGQRGLVVGWFRRGVAPYVDLLQVETQTGNVVTSHPAFWPYLGGGLGVLLGLALLIL